jgi:hypothetical protein
MDGKPSQIDPSQLDVLDAWEELVLKARVVARKIEERVLRAMGGHAVPPPHFGGAEASDRLAVADE